jgi:Tol biopolymer transport system component
MRKPCPRAITGLILCLVAVSASLAPVLAKKPGGGGGDGGPTAVELNPALAFVTTQNDGRQDVVVASADFSSEIVLTASIQSKRHGAYTHLFYSPAWSSDGTMVAFWADDLTASTYSTKLYVVKADGSQILLVRDFGSRPTIHRPANSPLNWCPSGLELVYDSMSHAVVAISVLTGDIRVLLDGFETGDPVEQPSLSPDLEETPGYQGMLAVRGLDGSVDPDGQNQWDIYVMQVESDASGYLLPIDSGTIVNVTNAPGTDEFHPSWSPDGRQIACFHDDGTDEGLAVIDVASGQVLPVWPDYATNVNGEDRATWTSDGRYLVYRTEFSGIDAFDLTIIRADGTGGPANLTTSTRRERGPAWNPNWDPFGPGAN